jgi:hypothetical protein
MKSEILKRRAENLKFERNAAGNKREMKWILSASIK